MTPFHAVSRRRGKMLAVATALSLGFAAGVAGPASAHDAPAVSADASSETPSVGLMCSSGWRYLPSKLGAQKHTRIGPTLSNYNGTNRRASMVLTSEVSGTVSMSVTGSTNVSASLKAASISSKFDITASVSLTAKVGNSMTISVPAKKTGNGNFGVWRVQVAGSETYFLNNCTAGANSKTTVWAPFRVGWHTWIS